MSDPSTRYLVLSPVQHDGELYDVGATLALTGAAAAPLVEAGVIKPAAGEEAEDREEILDRAVAALDPDAAADWTSAGLPQVAALERETGAGVTAAERDAAWVRFQQARSAAGE